MLRLDDARRFVDSVNRFLSPAEDNTETIQRMKKFCRDLNAQFPYLTFDTASDKSPRIRVWQ